MSCPLPGTKPPAPAAGPSSPAIQWTNRALVRLVWPLIIEQVLAVTMGLADTVMVAAVGESAVSAVSLVDSLNVLLNTAMAALATGGAVVASQYIGRGQAHRASGAARQLVYVVGAMALLFASGALLFRRPVLRLLFGHVEPAVMAHAETYLWLSAVSYPFIALYNAGAAIFRSMGNSRVGMLVALLVNVVNIGGNALFIFGLGMGVAGAALATLLSRAGAAVILLWMLVRRQSGPLSLAGLFRFSLDGALIRQILRIGVPNGVENSVFQIGKLMLNRLISTFGTAAIAANAVAHSMNTFIILPVQAFGLALLTVVGQCVGAQDYAAARRHTKKLMGFASLLMVVLDIAVMLFHRPVVDAFALSAEGAAMANHFLALYSVVSMPLWPTAFVLPHALRAAGDARFTMGTSMFSMWVFRIGFGYLFALGLGFGPVGVWYAMFIDWVVRCAFFLWRWLSGRWQKRGVIR